MSFPDYVRVTDEVKPRREYSVVRSALIEGVHQVLNKPGAHPDGQPIAPKHTPDELAGKYDALKVDALKDEIARRNSDRTDDPIVPDEPGNKAELVAALEADDASVGVE